MAMTIKGRMEEIWRDQPCIYPEKPAVWGGQLPSDVAIWRYLSSCRRNVLLEALEGPSLLSYVAASAIGSKLLIKGT